MFKRLLVGICLVSPFAQAQVFKCVGPDGHTTYSQAPCPSGVGTATEIRNLSSSAQNIPAPAPGNEAERLDTALAWAYQRYPFLNVDSPYANSNAINDVIMRRDQEIAGGMDPADAIVSAVSRVAPQYESAEIVRRNSRAADILSNADQHRQAEAERLARQQAEEQAQAEEQVRKSNKPDRVHTVCNSFGNTNLCKSSDGSRWTTVRDGNHSRTWGKDADGDRFKGSSSTVGGTTFSNTRYQD